MQNFLPILWGVLGSAAVSLVISIFVFVIGVRIGKERADRNVMRDKYQELFQHFKSLATSLATKKIRTWQSYPLIENYYSPPVRKYLNDGTLNLFPERLAKRLLDTETDVLTVSSKIVAHAFTVTAPMIEEEITASLAKKPPETGSKTVREINVLQLTLMNDDDFRNLREALTKNPDMYLGLDTSIERGICRTRYIRADLLRDGCLHDFVNRIYGIAAKSRTDDYLDIPGLKKRLDAAISLLARRIKDPHPLRETVANTLLDLFR